jgi:hypothetical protein
MFSSLSKYGMTTKIHPGLDSIPKIFKLSSPIIKIQQRSNPKKPNKKHNRKYKINPRLQPKNNCKQAKNQKKIFLNSQSLYCKNKNLQNSK